MTKGKLKDLINFETERLELLKTVLMLDKYKDKKDDILRKITQIEDKLTKDILEYKRLCVQFQ